MASAADGDALLFWASSVVSSGGINAEFWQYWAVQVGGAAAAIGTDGRVPADVDLTTLVIGLLQES